MKYSARARRAMVKCFKLALERLPDTLRSTSPYICDCIRYTSRRDFPAADAAMNFIAERIGHMFSVESWLKAQSEEIADAVRYDVNYNNGKKLQAYRKAWLESLIKEFEA